MLIISYDCIKTREGTDIRGVFRKYETEEIRMRQGRKADEHLSGKAEKRMYHRGKNGNLGWKKKKPEGKIWEIAWQSPIEHRILNRLDPEGCNNNTGDNDNQRSQYHVIHDFTLRFLLMSERNAPL